MNRKRILGIAGIMILTIGVSAIWITRQMIRRDGETNRSNDSARADQRKNPVTQAEWTKEERAKIIKIREYLQQEIDVTPLQKTPTVTFKNLINDLKKRFPDIFKKINLEIDNDAFQKIPNAPKLMDVELSFVDLPDQIEIGTVLRLALSRYEIPGTKLRAVFLIRPENVVITLSSTYNYEDRILRVLPSGAISCPKPYGPCQANLVGVRCL